MFWRNQFNVVNNKSIKTKAFEWNCIMHYTNSKVWSCQVPYQVHSSARYIRWLITFDSQWYHLKTAQQWRASNQWRIIFQKISQGIASSHTINHKIDFTRKLQMEFFLQKNAHSWIFSPQICNWPRSLGRPCWRGTRSSSPVSNSSKLSSTTRPRRLRWGWWGWWAMVAI